MGAAESWGHSSPAPAGARREGLEPTGCCQAQCGEQTASVATARLLSLFIAYSSERASVCPFVYDFAAKSVDRSEILLKTSTCEVMVLLHQPCSTSAQAELALSFQLGSAVILSDINTIVGCCPPQQKPLSISPLQPFTCHFDSSFSSCLQVQGYCQGLPTDRSPASGHTEGLGFWEALASFPEVCTVICPVQLHREVPLFCRFPMGSGLSKAAQWEPGCLSPGSLLCQPVCAAPGAAASLAFYLRVFTAQREPSCPNSLHAPNFIVLSIYPYISIWHLIQVLWAFPYILQTQPLQSQVSPEKPQGSRALNRLSLGPRTRLSSLPCRGCRYQRCRGLGNGLGLVMPALRIRMLPAASSLLLLAASCCKPRGCHFGPLLPFQMDATGKGWL